MTATRPPKIQFYASGRLEQTLQARATKRARSLSRQAQDDLLRFYTLLPVLESLDAERIVEIIRARLLLDTLEEQRGDGEQHGEVTTMT